MLIKLLKYELKFTGRTLLPIYGALLALALLLNLGDGLDFSFNNSGNWGDLLFTLLIFAYSCVVSAVCIITVVLLVQRFYKNLLRDEGYLMHTLPVTQAQNVAAKLICAVIWSVVSLFMAAFSVMLMNMSWVEWCSFWSGLFDLIHDLNVAFGIHWLLYTLEALLALLLMLGSNIVQVYLALAIGHMANNRKIACSVGAFIGLQVLSSLLAQVFGRMVVSWDWLVDLINEIFNGFMHQQIVGIHTLMLGTICCFLVYTAVMFIATNWIMKNKLNLE